MVAGVTGEHVARAVQLVDEAAAVVVLVVLADTRLDEAPVQIADVGCADGEARAQVVVALVENVGDGGESCPVEVGGAPEESGRGGGADFLDDPDAVELRGVVSEVLF